jgi:hypothetical protein
MANFIIPYGAMPPEPPPPPPDPAAVREQAIADNTRAESELNRFMTAKQDALFNAPDAYYRTQGADAIRTAPFILDGLSRLKEDALDGLANDAQRRKLGAALDAHLQLTRDDIARHVAEQSKVWQRQTALDRIALLTKEAAYRHNDDGLIDVLGTAAGNAARAHARVGDQTPDIDAEDAAAAKARSGILNAAIQARLDSGATEKASALFDRTKDQLDPAHAEPLKAQIDTAQDFNSTKTYAYRLYPVMSSVSIEDADAQHTVASQQADADHVQDPRQRALAQHFIDPNFDVYRRVLDQEKADRANDVRDWLNKPSPDGKPQTSLPPPGLWKRLSPDEQSQMLVQLRENALPTDRPDDHAANLAPTESSTPRWEDLSLWDKFKTGFQRFGAEGEARGAAFGVDSAARHLQTIDELTRRQEAGEELNVIQKQFLLKNRGAASNLARSVGRFVDAQRRIADLPRSTALRQLYEAPTAADAARIIAAHPGEIAKAFGVESVPDFLMQMAAVGAMGPVGAGAALGGSAGLQGYASGLIGALSHAGVDVTDPDRPTEALHDKDLMERVRDQATKQGAIDAGVTLAAAMMGGRKGSKGPQASQSEIPESLEFQASTIKPAKPTRAEQFEINKAAGKAFEEETGLELQGTMPAHARQVTMETLSGKRVRLDFMALDPSTGRIICIECKASPTARLSKDQKIAFPEIESTGGYVKGRAGEPHFPAGTKTPPTKVDVRRKP